MYKINDLIVYKRDVCRILDIKKNFHNGDYYLLIPFLDESLKEYVPVDNRFNNIRDLMDKKTALKLINKIKDIGVIESEERMIENEYKKLMNSNQVEDLIKIIKTTYLRNEKRINENKKIGDKDDSYFKRAEKYFYTELSVVLNMSYDETKDFVVKKVHDNT